MPKTYSAILKGDRLEWTGPAPESALLGRTVEVEVAIVRDVTPKSVDPEERRRIILDALGRIAARGTFDTIDDPVAWQREVRRDRQPLPVGQASACRPDRSPAG